MTTRKQEKAFMEVMISDSFLADAIDWIKENMSVEDVFDHEELCDWAVGEGFVDFDDEDHHEAITTWAKENCEVDEVYDEEVLGEWAVENGYVLEEDVDHEAWAEENGYVLADDTDSDDGSDDIDASWPFPVDTKKKKG